MPKRSDIETILIIGSGPIVIGQFADVTEPLTVDALEKIIVAAPRPVRH